MNYVVNAIFFVIYYLITIPICLIILAFWVIMLVIAILVMVLVMVAETWLSQGVPNGPMAVIDRVKTSGPKLVGDILRKPLRKLSEDDGKASRGPLAFIYSDGFTGIVLPILACVAVITLFATFGNSLAALRNMILAKPSATVAPIDLGPTENSVVSIDAGSTGDGSAVDSGGGSNASGPLTDSQIPTSSPSVDVGPGEADRPVPATRPTIRPAGPTAESRSYGMGTATTAPSPARVPVNSREKSNPEATVPKY